MISTVTLNPKSIPHISKKEVLRYAGCKSGELVTSETNALFDGCEKETEGIFTYKVSYTIVPVTTNCDTVCLGDLAADSKDLLKNLEGCGEAVIFAATVGVGIDRLIARYAHLSPSKALMLESIGTERVEALADAFVLSVEKENNVQTKPRYSPGYGDLPLSFQRSIFSLLECEKRMGLYLNDTLLMTPRKSVTAIVGIMN